MPRIILIFFIATCLQWSLIQGNAPYVSPPASTEPPPVCLCEYRYNPVCGSDNVTYINENVLDCINNVNPTRGLPVVKKLHSSECRSLVCQKSYLPVCTLDGQTYPNECELVVENIRRIKQNKTITYLAYRAECIGRPCGCTTKAAPVCGDDEVVYRNQCVLDCASYNNVKRGKGKITFKNNGACLNTCICPQIYDPICGSDGQKYNNLCELHCANITLNHSKNEPITVADNSVCEGCWCTAQYDPVCGSDGKTYSNECQLHCTAKRQNDPNLVAVSKGECPLCYCKDVDSPVCGTDHVTYRNECYLRFANNAQTAPTNRHQHIGLYHNGACLPNPSCSCKYCPPEYGPVCGNNGQSYYNICWLLCYADCLKTAGLQGIWPTKIEACYM